MSNGWKKALFSPLIHSVGWFTFSIFKLNRDETKHKGWHPQKYKNTRDAKQHTSTWWLLPFHPPHRPITFSFSLTCHMGYVNWVNWKERKRYVSNTHRTVCVFLLCLLVVLCAFKQTRISIVEIAYHTGLSSSLSLDSRVLFKNKHF